MLFPREYIKIKFFHFFKIIFNINTSKRSKNIKKKINSKKKFKFFKSMVGSQKQTLSLSATFTIWVFLSVQTFSTALGSVGIRILKRLAGLKGPLFSVDGLST
jgi:hypothetical protein